MTPCKITGCDKQAEKRGWCGKHYYRWRTYGDPNTTTRNYGAKRHTTVAGYVRVWCPGHPTAMSDGYAYEHRKIWYDAHGPILDGHHVHHLNGDKADNDLANLELLDEAEHHRHHNAEAGMVTNQYGTWARREA